MVFAVHNALSSYVRFVTQCQNSDSGVREGIFLAAYEVRDCLETPEYDRRRLIEILHWFGAKLPRPTRLNRTKSKGYYRRNPKGVCWMKSSATEHIEKMEEIAAIVIEHGWRTDRLFTNSPGYVVYEDAYQIVAEPYADSALK